MSTTTTARDERAIVAAELAAYGVTRVPDDLDAAWQLLADLALSGIRLHAV